MVIFFFSSLEDNIIQGEDKEKKEKNIPEVVGEWERQRELSFCDLERVRARVTSGSATKARVSKRCCKVS